MGLLHALVTLGHVSEMGKIAARSPEKAADVTGTFPAVPETGIIVVESTAEGRESEFYRLAESSRAACQHVASLKRSLQPKTFKFHFFPYVRELTATGWRLWADYARARAA